jgi:hypothetical protein
MWNAENAMTGKLYFPRDGCTRPFVSLVTMPFFGTNPAFHSRARLIHARGHLIGFGNLQH